MTGIHLLEDIGYGRPLPVLNGMQKTGLVTGELQPARVAWIFRIALRSRDRRPTCVIGGTGLLPRPWPISELPRNTTFVGMFVQSRGSG